MDADLLETLRQAQRFGFFGDGPIGAAVEHARAFVEAIEATGPSMRIVDLGSGGGLPGLVLADAFPDDHVVLLDRREKRTDFLQRAVRRHRWHHVEVWCVDAADAVRDVAAERVAPFDVVTARGFGPPEFTLRTAVGLLGGHGQVVISEPPTGDRWPAHLVAELGLRAQRAGPVRSFRR